jgi:imidazoleglycerol phosphate dehydratase HisB
MYWDFGFFNKILILYWSFSGARIGEVKRVTKETNVSVKINLDGTGIADSSSGIPFLDHMLDVSIFNSFASYYASVNFYLSNTNKTYTRH